MPSIEALVSHKHLQPSIERTSSLTHLIVPKSFVPNANMDAVPAHLAAQSSKDAIAG